MVEKQSGYTLKIIRFDKGREFTSLEFDCYFTTHGIPHELANTGTPFENGVIEWKNNTLVEMARTMLTHN